MANWTDGPEYAPAERPVAFETPAVPALEVPVAPARPGADAPAAQPSYQAPSGASPDLATLVPALGPEPRDPRSAFEVSRATITTASAWGSAHSSAGTLPVATWTPQQPLTQSATTTVTYPAPPSRFGPTQFNPSPLTQQPSETWFAPIQPVPVVPGPRPVSVGQMWQAATPGVMLPLLVGALLTPLSLVMLFVSFSLTARVTHRRRQVRQAFGLALLAVLAVSGLSLLDDAVDAPMFYDLMAGWAQWACWGLPAVILLVVGAGIRAGEPPEYRP